VVRGYLPDDTENPEHIRLDLEAIPPSHDPTDFPSRCFQINTDYVRFLVAGVDVWTHSDAFFGTLAERNLAAQRFVELQILLMCGNIPCEETDTMRLRQNPLNYCQLEQSHDNGATWTLAFDYAKCLKSAGVADNSVVINNVSEAIAVASALSALYVGDYHAIAPGMHYDLSDDDDLRNQAYCYANQLLLLQMSAALQAKQEAGWTSKWDKIGTIAEVVTYVSELVLGLVIVTGARVHPGVLTAVEIVNIVANVVDDYVEGIDSEPPISEGISAENQALLVCCAMDVVGGMTPSMFRFQTMFDVCSDAALGGLVGACIHALVDSEQMYVAYLALVQAAFEAIVAGQRFDCPCAEETMTFEFELPDTGAPNTTYGLGGWYNNPSDLGMFNYQVGLGILSGDEITGDTYNARGVNAQLDGVTGEIHSVSVVFDYARGTFETGDKEALISYGGDNQSWGLYEWFIEVDAVATRNAFRDVHDGTINVVIYTDSRSGSAPPFIGSCCVKRIIVAGRNLSFA